MIGCHQKSLLMCFLLVKCSIPEQIMGLSLVSSWQVCLCNMLVRKYGRVEEVLGDPDRGQTAATADRPRIESRETQMDWRKDPSASLPSYVEIRYVGKDLRWGRIPRTRPKPKLLLAIMFATAIIHRLDNTITTMISAGPRMWWPAQLRPLGLPLS